MRRNNLMGWRSLEHDIVFSDIFVLLCLSTWIHTPAVLFSTPWRSVCVYSSWHGFQQRYQHTMSTFSSSSFAWRRVRRVRRGHGLRDPRTLATGFQNVSMTKNRTFAGDKDIDFSISYITWDLCLNLKVIQRHTEGGPSCKLTFPVLSHRHWSDNHQTHIEPSWTVSLILNRIRCAQKHDPLHGLPQYHSIYTWTTLLSFE